MRGPLNLLSAAVLSLAALGAFAQGTRSSAMPDARSSALGGRHVAQPSGTSLLFSNPAGFAACPSEFEIARATAQLSGPVFDIAQLFIDGDAAEASAVSRLLDPAGRLYTAADVGGPFSIAYVGKGLGLGFFNRSWAEVNAPSLMRMDLDVSEEFLFLAGYAYRFKLGPALALDAGLMPKAFLRFEIPYPTDILGLSGLIQNAAESLDAASFSTTVGVGLDAGLRVSLLDRFAFAVAARDAYTPTFRSDSPSFGAFKSDITAAFDFSGSKGLVPCDLSVGFYANPPLGLVGRYLTSAEFFLDYKDILSLAGPLPPNPFLLVSAGAEITMHDIFHIRGGLGDGALSAGFGLGLSLFDLDVAIFGRELGSDLGERTVYNLLLSLSMKVK